MQIFNCGHCGHVVFFDSVQCMHCASTLAFLPPDHHGSPGPCARGRCRPVAAAGRRAARRALPPLLQPHHLGRLQLCRAAASPHLLCIACRQTHRLPDLSVSGNLRHWIRIEEAKRQLFYTLARLGLQPTDDSAPPPRRAHLRLSGRPGEPGIVTGHHGGTITLERGRGGRR